MAYEHVINNVINITNDSANNLSQNIGNYSSSELSNFAQLFFPSIIAYYIFQFFLTMILGLIIVRRDRENFWAIFITTQIIGAIVLFFIFIFPIIPQMIAKIWN